MRDHTKLRAFELADDLAVMIYKVTANFPKEEIYGLTSQMRRAAVSVPSNIVEGCSRSSQAEYSRFLEMALGSLKELHYQFSLSVRLDYTNLQNTISKDCKSKLTETSKVLSALFKKMR